MAFEYKYRVKGLNKVDPEIAGKVCQELTESEGGLTPKTLVAASRDENAPLHSEFEWNDSIAGEKYREFQARKLIGNLIITKSDTGKEREVQFAEQEYKDRGFVSVGSTRSSSGNDHSENNEDEGKKQYVPLFAALSNEAWKQSLFESAKRDLQYFKAKYYRLEQLSKIIADIDDLLGA